MKIYTRTGDEGMSSLIGGKRVPKNHERLEAYGTVDELISWVGLIRDQDIQGKYKSALVEIQKKLMNGAAMLAADCDPCDKKIPLLGAEDVAVLENWMDEMEKELKPLDSFILPGGDQVVSYCHIARTVCRRAERRTAALDPRWKNRDLVLIYLNRLSDYMYVLSRKIGSDMGAEEIPWRPDL